MACEVACKRASSSKSSGDTASDEVSAQRDFSAFKRLYEKAAARTTAARAVGGNVALAENQSDLDNARNVLLANDGVASVTGNRSAPSGVNWLLDYEFSREARLKGTRIAIYGNWRDRYNLTNLGGINYRGGATHPVGMYAIHRRKVFDRPVSFRFGIKNLIDLQSPNKIYRRSAVVALNSDGTTVNQYRYLEPLSADFTVTVDF